MKWTKWKRALESISLLGIVADGKPRGVKSLYLTVEKKLHFLTKDGALSSSCEILISGELSVCDKLKKNPSLDNVNEQDKQPTVTGGLRDCSRV